MVKVDGVYKWYNSILAVKDVSFYIDKGDILGFIGPNGAGKSTTMRMITGFLPISEGVITVGGYDVATNPIETKKMIGYLPENAPLYSDMTVKSFLGFCSEIRGFFGREKVKCVDSIIDKCFLESVKNQQINTLSKGYKRRTCFAQSILHNPDVLVLDEPTDGLDPNQKSEIRNMITEMSETKAIIVSTHILEEVSAVCNRVILIDDGSKVYDGTPKELVASFNKAEAIITIKKYTDDVTLQLNSIDNIKTIETLYKSDNTVKLKVICSDYALKDTTYTDIYNLAKKNSDWILHEMRQEESSMDEVFRNLTVDKQSYLNGGDN